jgi:hypothetical protein
MNDIHDLSQHIAAGALLATVDGIDYRAVHLVAYLDDAAEPHIYCPTEQWRQSPIGRLAERDRCISELETANMKQAEELLRYRTRLVEMEQRLNETPRDNQERMFAHQHADTPPAAATGVPATVEAQALPAEMHRCSETGCDRAFSSKRALSMHHGRMHGNIKYTPPVPTADAVEPPWLCASCQTNVFAPSVRDPALCQRCARNAQAAGSNGQAVAA